MPVRLIRVPREQRVLQLAPLAGPDRRHAAKRLAADAHLLVTRWYQWHAGPTLPLVLRGFAQPDTPGRAYASLATVIAKLLAALGAGLGLPRRWWRKDRRRQGFGWRMAYGRPSSVRGMWQISLIFSDSNCAEAGLLSPEKHNDNHDSCSSHSSCSAKAVAEMAYERRTRNVLSAMW